MAGFGTALMVRAKVASTTPMTPELFMQWKTKKTEAREASLDAQRAERAKNDRMSGRELFLSDASLFVDDAEAYDKYQREEEVDADPKVNMDTNTDRPSSSASTTGREEGNPDHDDDIGDIDDDDDLDMDELNELEASLSKTTLQIKEPADNV